MFKLFGKKAAIGTTITLKLSGLHCASCSLNIDDELESTPGVISSNTSYAKQTSVVTYDPTITNPSALRSLIEKLGYKVL